MIKSYVTVRTDELTCWPQFMNEVGDVTGEHPTPGTYVSDAPEVLTIEPVPDTQQGRVVIHGPGSAQVTYEASDLDPQPQRVVVIPFPGNTETLVLVPDPFIGRFI